MSLLSKLKKHGAEVRDAMANRTFDSTDTFKPAEGDSSIRILPHWDVKKRDDGESFFFVRRVVHFIPQPKSDGTGTYNGPVACRQMFNKPCPICKAESRLRKAKMKQKASDIKATERYLYNIIDYGEKGERDPKVLVYPVTPTIHAEILAWLDDLKEEFWDLKEGRDWKLTKTVDKKKGPIFGTKYKIKPSLQPSAVPSKLLKGLDEALVNLDDMWNKDEEKVMLAALKTLGIKANSDDEEEEEEVEEEEDDDDDRRPSKSSKDDDEEEEEEEDEEEERPKSKAKSKAKSEEDEEEEKPKSKSKTKSKPKEEEADEEEEDDEEEEEDEEEERPAKKSAAKAASKKKAVDDEEEDKPKFKRKAKKSDDDEDLESELKRLGV